MFYNTIFHLKPSSLYVLEVMFTFCRCRNQANKKQYNNQNMKLQFITSEAKPLQVSTFGNNSIIA